MKAPPPDVFERAALIRPGRIGGYRLQPYTLWHSWLLYCLRSPYYLGGEPTVESTAVALLVCTARWPNGLRQIERFYSSRMYRIMCYFRLFICQHERVLKELDNHISAYSQSPHCGVRISRDSGASILLGSPYEWNAVRLLMCTYGMRLEEAWNTPKIVAGCLKVMADEVDGGPPVGWRSDLCAYRDRIETPVGPGHPVWERIFGKGEKKTADCRPQTADRERGI